MYYESEMKYVMDQAKGKARVDAIDALIDALLTTALEAVTNADVQEYMLNDGQTIIKKVYRSPDQIISTVTNLRKIRAAFIGDTLSRSVRLVDAKNVRYTIKRP